MKSSFAPGSITVYQFLIGTVLQLQVADAHILNPDKSEYQFLIGTVLRQRRFRLQKIQGVSIPYRYGTTRRPKRVPKERKARCVSIPYRYGTTRRKKIWTEKNSWVSIPYRYGTTTQRKTWTKSMIVKYQFLIGTVLLFLTLQVKARKFIRINSL